MSDPLSVARSIAGVVSLADTGSRLVFKYARSTLHAKGDIGRLASEIKTFAGILQSLRVLAGRLEEGQPFDSTIRIHHPGTPGSNLDSLE